MVIFHSFHRVYPVKTILIMQNNSFSKEEIENSSTRLAPKGLWLLQLLEREKLAGRYIDAYKNQSLIALIPNEKEVLPKYLFNYLKWNYSKLRSLSDIAGVRGNLSGSLLSSFPINYPNVDIQETIVRFLSCVDAKIANNKAMMESSKKTWRLTALNVKRIILPSAFF